MSDADLKMRTMLYAVEQEERMPEQPQQGSYIGARVPTELALEFERLARAEDRTVSAELRRLIRRHVEQQGAPCASPARRRAA